MNRTTDADLLCALAGVAFAGAALTLRHDRDPHRRALAFGHAIIAVRGLERVVRELVRAYAAEARFNPKSSDSGLKYKVARYSCKSYSREGAR